ncbi:hypothetical protein [Nocardia sp. NPDC005978]|uniref:hypothetical protein n=1 Tax=unclassified Nocardia TaxID=2637762 RepID=UPI0033AE2345
MPIMVFSTPRDGMDAEYNEWYENIHISDMLDIPGVLSCTRHRRINPTDPDDLEYLAVYDVDGDPLAVLKEIGARSADGRLRLNPSVDPQRLRMTVWQPL